MNDRARERRPSVRMASASDARSLADLIREYWRFEGIAGFRRPAILASLNRVLGDATLGRCWLVERDRRPFGYLLAVYVFSLEHGGMMAEIDEFYVAERFRGGGAGAALLREAQRHLAASGCVRLQLQLGAGNERAGRFYRRRGFGPRNGYHLWDKRLSKPRGDPIR